MAQMSPAANYAVTPDLASLIAAEAALARNASNLTSGTVDPARVGDLSPTYVTGTVNDLSAFGIYFPEFDGAVANGQQKTDGVTDGVSTAFTSATANFVPGDVGKAISIPGAGVAGALLFTTIAGYVSATQITLAVATSTATSGIVFRWGTDNGAAFNSCMTRCAASKNGQMRLRHGVYLTSGTMTIPNSKAVTIEGDSHEFTGTTIMRFGGTQTIMSAAGSSGGNSLCTFRMRNIEFHGGDLSGTMLNLAGVSNSEMVGVKLCFGTGTMLRLSQWFNSSLTRCYFQNGGSGTTSPAVVMDYESTIALSSSSNTVHFIGCEWEFNGGTDLRITGSDGSGSGGQPQDWTIAVFLTNCKMERIIGNYPLIDIDRGGAIEFSDCFFHLAGSATAAHVWMKGTACVPVRPVTFSNCNFSSNTWNGSGATTGAVIPYFIDMTTGVMLISNCGMNGNPTSDFIHIGSAVGLADVRLSNVSVTNRSILFQDDRAGSLYGYGTIPLTAAFSTIAASLSVNRVIWNLPDAATNTITYYNVAIPADAAPGRPIKIRVLWYSDSNAGAIRWDVGYRYLTLSGDLITGGQTDILTTVTVPGTANNTTTTTFQAASSVNPEANYIAIYLARIGADAADTCTGGGRVLGAELLYELAM